MRGGGGEKERGGRGGDERRREGKREQKSKFHDHAHLQVCVVLTLASTLAFPTTTIPYLARVRATLSRRASFKKPIPWCSLARTQERMM